MALQDSILPLITGAAAGIAFGPEAAPIGEGLGQLINSSTGLDKAATIKPKLTDSEDSGYLNNILNRSKSLDVGSEFNSANQNINEQLAGTQDNIVKAGGGASGATLSGLIEAQKVASRGANAVYGQQQNTSNYFNGLANNVMDRIQKRRLDLQNYDYISQLAQSAQDKKGGQANALLGLTEKLSGGKSGGLMDNLSSLFSNQDSATNGITAPDFTPVIDSATV